MSDNYVGRNPSPAAGTQVTLDALAARIAVLEAARPTLGAPTPAAGTFVDFAIPAGAKQVVVSYIGISTNGASSLRLQLATGGAIDATPTYFGGDNRAGGAGDLTGFNDSNGFDTPVGVSAAAVLHGAAILTLVNPATNIWSCVQVLGQSDVARAGSGGGSKALAGVLDRVRLTTLNGIDVFDAGSFNIMVIG